MSYSIEEFYKIMMTADKVEEIVEHGDLIIGLVALSAVIARGGRIAIQKAEGEFTKQDLLDMVADKVDYWFDFYEHLDDVKKPTGD